MHKKKSIKTKVFAVLLVMQVPLILIVLIFSLYFVNFFNTKVSESNRNALKSYCDVLEDHLERLSNRMVNFIAMNTDFKLLSTDTEYLDAHIHSLDILKAYETLLDENRLLYGCYIVNRPHDIFREVYGNDAADYGINKALREYFEAYTDTEDKVMDRAWKPLMAEGHPFLTMVRGYKGTYCVYIIDVDRIRLPQNEPASVQDGEIILLGDDLTTVLNCPAALLENDIAFLGTDTYYFSGSPKRYMIIEMPVRLGELRAAYIMQYKGFFGSLSSLQKAALIIAVGVAIMLIPMGYRILKRVFFRPVDALVDTMNTIREGNMEIRADETWGGTEFFEVNNTFNSMISQIRDLKIETYEKELKLRQTQLDYFQIQIRPHFYVNCLKSIYGMLEERRYEDTKSSIIFLSRHLRYMLKGASMIVSVAEELQYVRNYMDLQHISMAYPPDCKIEVDEALAERKIPAISILSFVENSIKYGTRQNQPLKITIQIQSMASEDGDYMNIHISDNGVGFDEEQLKCLNAYETPENNGRSIGIYNVIARFFLYFGQDNVLFGFSNMDGAHVDIFIKEKE